MRYNIEAKKNGVNATRLKVPDAVGRLQDMTPSSSGTLLDEASDKAEDVSRVRGVSVTSESEDFSPSGVMGSGIYDEPLTTDPSRLMDWARETVPVESEPDCTDWMVPAKAYVANLKARSNEYKRAGSSMTVNAGDPFVPGVRNGQMAFESKPGVDIADSGEARIIAGNEEFSIDAPGNGTVVGENLLGWAAATDIQDRQWVGSMMSIEELTSNPSQPIGFPSIGNNTGPLFVGHSISRPALIHRVTSTIQSSQAQTINFKLRSSNDYTNVLNSFTQDVPKGTSTMSFRVFAPTLSPMVAEIKPEDGTQAVLADYSVRP